MQKLTNESLQEAFIYLRPEPEYNLFLIGDLERFGMEGEDVSCYTADGWKKGAEFPWLILDYRDNYLVYSRREDYDAETVAAFLKERKTKNISGKDTIIRRIVPYLEDKVPKPTYLARLNQVTEEQKEQAGALMKQVRRLTEEDIPAVYELYLQIDEFAYTYRNQPREESFEDIRMNISVLGRSYGVFEGDRLVSIAQTSAENSRSAMVVGVATHPEKRQKGYARATVLKLCQDCLKEGMEFLCLFYDNPAAGVIYHAIGFHDMGMYTMLRDRDKEQAVVTLKKGAGRSLKAGGAWIYDNEIDRIRGEFEEGAMIRVEDFDGYPMGQGFINTKSKITVRMMTRKKDAVVDGDFIEMRVRNAWNYRKDTVDTESCRVIFGEADFLPGIVIDKFSDVLVVESLALGIDRWKPVIVDRLKKVLEEDGIRIRGVYERSDAKVRLQEGMERFKGFLGQPFDTKVEIRENGVRYQVDVEDGQKTGFFLDQKYNRQAVGRLCAGKKVLDCFTHTGSFALNAGASGAASVLAVDASEPAVEQARKNAALNGLEDRIRFVCRDVFELLPELEQAGERFDVVILDPPAFTKSRNSIKNAVKGYREINLRGMKLVKDGGYLATCSCSHFMDPELFAKTIREAAAGVHRRLRQVEYRTQAADHPILWAADSSYYLKFYIFQVCEEQ